MTLKWATAAGLQSITAGVEWTSVTGTPTIETTIVRDNGTAFRVAPGATKQHQHSAYSSGQGVKYYRVYFYLVTAPASTRAFVSIDNGASLKLGVRVTNARLLQLFNEEDGTQIGSNSSAINTGEFYRLELKVDDTTLSSTSVEARVYAAASEGTLAWNPSGTADLAASPNRLSIANRADANLDFVYTDIVIIEGDATAPNTWAGRGSIIYLRPDGDSGTPQWARGGTDSGANWSQTDETPPNDATDYVESNTNNQVDDYTLGATPAAVNSGDTINWVVPGVRFAISNTTGGDPDFVLRITAGGNTDESGNVSGAGSTSYASYQTTPVCVFPMVSVDMPGASTTAWTKSDLDSAVIGIRESATDTHLARVSALWLMFDHKPGSGYTLTASAGSLTESGVSASLLWGHASAPSVASYSLTGISATLTRNVPLTASAGTYALTGVNPNLLWGHVLPASVGSYSITDVSPALLWKHILVAGLGTYTITGIDATLTKGSAGAYTLTANAGSLALSGVSASLLWKHILSAGLGSYALTGVSSDLYHGYRLAADAGVYTLTGVAITILWAHILSAAAGTYTITGIAASLNSSTAHSPTAFRVNVSRADILVGARMAVRVKRDVIDADTNKR